MGETFPCHSRPISAYGVNSSGNPEEGMRGLDSRVKPDYDKERFGIEIIDSRTLGGWREVRLYDFPITNALLTVGK
jgi:hypothetical protein